MSGGTAFHWADTRTLKNLLLTSTLSSLPLFTITFNGSASNILVSYSTGMVWWKREIGWMMGWLINGWKSPFPLLNFLPHPPSGQTKCWVCGSTCHWAPPASFSVFRSHYSLFPCFRNKKNFLPYFLLYIVKLFQTMSDPCCFLWIRTWVNRVLCDWLIR